MPKHEKPYLFPMRSYLQNVKLCASVMFESEGSYQLPKYEYSVTRFTGIGMM